MISIQALITNSMDKNKITLEDIEQIDDLADDKIVLLSEVVKKNDKKFPRLTTGFLELDRVMNGGFKNGDLVIISGVSGEGKTTFAQTLTHNLCLFNIPVCWFSYEVSLEHLDNKFREMGIESFYKVYVPEKKHHWKT